MWVWLWVLFVVVLFALPLGYGTGYRRWGAPYPYYVRRRRRPVGIETVDEWGWLADLVWVVFIVAGVWLLFALLF